MRLNAPGFILAGIVACAVCAALAQSPATKPARTPIVTVKLSDGSVVRGQLVSADPDKIVVKPTGAKDPREIAWPDVASVSNGLTRDKALVDWKELHKDELCDTCKGDRVADCATCKGSGFDQAHLTACAKCGARGNFPCTNKKCDKGKVDCPKPCLKLTQGQWKARDGKKWRDFKGKGGTHSWSDGHLGELIEMKDGVPTNLGKCPTCGGTTKVDCDACAGKGAIDCADCRGTGNHGPPCPDCKAGDVACAACAGTGLKSKAGG